MLEAVLCFWLAAGLGVRIAGAVVAAVMVGYIGHKLDLDASTIANFNGFKRELALFATDAERVIHGLPADLRLVVVLFFIDKLSHREIAEIASIPVGTAMSRLSRGRRLLQHGLAHHLRPQPTRRAGHSGD